MPQAKLQATSLLRLDLIGEVLPDTTARRPSPLTVHQSHQNLEIHRRYLARYCLGRDSKSLNQIVDASQLQTLVPSPGTASWAGLLRHTFPLQEYKLQP